MLLSSLRSQSRESARTAATQFNAATAYMQCRSDGDFIAVADENCTSLSMVVTIKGFNKEQGGIFRVKALALRINL